MRVRVRLASVRRARATIDTGVYRSGARAERHRIWNVDTWKHPRMERTRTRRARGARHARGSRATHAHGAWRVACGVRATSWRTRESLYQYYAAVVNLAG